MSTSAELIARARYQYAATDELHRALADALESAEREMHARELHHFEVEKIIQDFADQPWDDSIEALVEQEAGRRLMGGSDFAKDMRRQLVSIAEWTSGILAARMWATLRGGHESTVSGDTEGTTT